MPLANGLAQNDFGIDYVSGNTLFIENCRIFAYNSFVSTASYGIRFRPSSGSSQLYISNSVIEGNGNTSNATGGGILIQPTGTANVRAVISGSKVQSNIQEIVVDGTGGSGSSVVQLRESLTAGNSFNGVWVKRAGVVVDKVSSVNNGGYGLLADGSGSLIFVGSSTVAGNGGGLGAQNGGQLFSYGNNQARGNSSDGGPTGSLTLN